MGDLIKAYNAALTTENDNPVAAIRIYKTDLINIDPTTSKEYLEGQIIKYLFLLGYVFGFIGDIYWCRELNLGWAIALLIFGPFIQGFLAVILFSGFANIAVNVEKLTKSEKYWVALLGYIGAARCAIRLSEPEKAKEYASALKKFGLTITDYLSDGLVALAQHDFVKAEHALSLAAHDQAPGIYAENIADAVYRCVLIHPKREQVIRRRPGGYPQQPPYPPQTQYPENVQHIHGDMVHGGQDVRVQGSVIHRSRVGGHSQNEDSWD